MHEDFIVDKPLHVHLYRQHLHHRGDGPARQHDLANLRVWAADDCAPNTKLLGFLATIIPKPYDFIRFLLFRIRQ